VLVTEDAKTSADQVDEIRKLVQDAQERLDQVARALRSLEDRLKRADRGEDDPY
jgi:methyl-accepting chemotaxis protein